MKNVDLRTSLLTLALVGSALLSSHAYGLVSGSLGLGTRWMKFDSDTSKFGAGAQELEISAHVDPIPLVPVAVGAVFSTLNYKKDDFYPKASKANGAEIALEVKGWVPMVPVITPYVKARYVLTGGMDYEFTSIDGTESSAIKSTLKYNGYLLKAGGEMSVLPLLSVFAEVGMGSGSYEFSKISADGIDGLAAENKKSQSYSASSVTVGISVGI